MTARTGLAAVRRAGSRPPDILDAQFTGPVTTIGPKRSRCLDTLRRDPALTALINTAEAA
jgi:hypothetical protein